MADRSVYEVAKRQWPRRSSDHVPRDIVFGSDSSFTFAESQVDYIPLFSKQSHVVEPAFASIEAIEGKFGPVSAIFNTVEYTDQ